MSSTGSDTSSTGRPLRRVRANAKGVSHNPYDKRSPKDDLSKRSTPNIQESQEKDLLSLENKVNEGSEYEDFDSQALHDLKQGISVREIPSPNGSDKESTNTGMAPTMKHMTQETLQGRVNELILRLKTNLTNAGYPIKDDRLKLLCDEAIKLADENSTFEEFGDSLSRVILHATLGVREELGEQSLTVLTSTLPSTMATLDRTSENLTGLVDKLIKELANERNKIVPSQFSLQDILAIAKQGWSLLSKEERASAKLSFIAQAIGISSIYDYILDPTVAPKAVPAIQAVNDDLCMIYRQWGTHGLSQFSQERDMCTAQVYAALGDLK